MNSYETVKCGCGKYTKRIQTNKNKGRCTKDCLIEQLRLDETRERIRKIAKGVR